MSIMPNPITVGLMRIRDMEQVKRLKSSLRCENERRVRSMQRDAACEGPAVSVW